MSQDKEKHWWGFPFLCGLIISVFAAVILCHPHEFLESLVYNLITRGAFVNIVWLFPTVLVVVYASIIWGGWGGLFSLLALTLIDVIANRALETTSKVFMENGLETSLESITVAPFLGLIFGVISAIIISFRMPKRPLSIMLLIAIVGFFNGLIHFGGRGSFVDWSIYIAELIPSLWLFAYPGVLSLLERS